MDRIWYSYLNSFFPTELISELVLYTDTQRYWFADKLIEAANQFDWKVSITLLDELIEDEMFEIKNSFPLLGRDTLLAGIFSQYNPVIEKINLIFDPFQSPPGYPGFSFISQYNFPNQYLADFLKEELNNVLDHQEIYHDKLQPGEIIISNEQGTYLEFDLDKIPVAYPYRATPQNKHVIFPATELVAEIVPGSMNGTIVIDKTIGEYHALNELIDPFGRMDQPIKILVEQNQIVDITDENSMGRRLKQYWLDLDEEEKMLTSISFGLGGERPTTGFLEVDRLSRSSCTIGNSIRNIEFVLDFNISQLG